MKCERCGKEVILDNSKGESWQYGFEVGGKAYHCGCAMLSGVSEPRKPRKFTQAEAKELVAKLGAGNE